MRVLQVTPTLRWPSGVAEYVAGIASGLAELGADVEVLAAGHPPAVGQPAHPLIGDVPVRWFRPRRLLGRYRYPVGMTRAIHAASRGADVIHTHQAYFPGTWIAATTRSRVAATLHLHPEHVVPDARRRHRRELDLLLRRLDLVAAVSRGELELIRSVRRPKLDCVVWPALAERPATPHERRTGRPLVLTVARLVATKGLENVLRAAAATGDVADWVVVGEGPERPRLESLCRELGLDPATTLLGGIDDVEAEQLFRTATVFVSASTEEAFGIAVLKAIANGSHPVVTDIPSHREMIETLGLRTDALLTVPVDPDEITSKVLRACRSGTPPASVIDRVPTWQDSAQLLLAAYGELLG